MAKTPKAAKAVTLESIFWECRAAAQAPEKAEEIITFTRGLLFGSWLFPCFSRCYLSFSSDLIIGRLFVYCSFSPTLGSTLGASFRGG